MGGQSQGHPAMPEGWWATLGAAAPSQLDLPTALLSRVQEFTTAAEHLDQSQLLAAARRLIDSLDGLWLEAVADFGEQDGPRRHGVALSLAGWLQRACRMTPAEANAKARLAQAVAADDSPTGVALRAGTISWRHAVVLDSSVRRLPLEARAEAEQALVEQATTLDPGQLRRVGERLLHCHDREQAEAAAVRRYESRGLTLATTLDGMVAVSGLLDPVTAAPLATAIDALTQAGKGDPTDHRSWPQRRADALAEIATWWLSWAATPSVAGSRPQVSVTVDLATLAGSRGCEPGHLDHVEAPVTTHEAQLLTCDSVVTPVLLAGPQEPLHVGRSQRTATLAQRKALQVRDGGCVAQGCAAPAWSCHAHHIRHWALGGATDLDNLALVCLRHHRAIHTLGWRIRHEAGGRYTCAPPVGLSP